MSAIDITLNKPYEYLLQATNSPTYWSYTNGPLGSYVQTVSTTAYMRGTPFIEGTYNTQIFASNNIGKSAPFSLTIRVLRPDPVPILANPGSRAHTVNSHFSYQVISNPSTSVTFALSGSIPTGVTINENTGLISGTPTIVGVYRLRITATNLYGTSNPVFLDLAVVTTGSRPITSWPRITLPTGSIEGIVNSSLSYQIVASDSPLRFSATNLPRGLSLNTTTGLISGVPVEAGTFGTNVQAFNTAGSGFALLYFVIKAPSTPRPPSGVVWPRWQLRWSASG